MRRAGAAARKGWIGLAGAVGLGTALVVGAGAQTFDRKVLS